MTTIFAGSTLANDGIIYGLTADTSTKTTSDPCTVDQKVKVDYGIIYGLTGIIYGFTGIIVTDFSSKEPVNCGIITAG